MQNIIILCVAIALGQVFGMGTALGCNEGIHDGVRRDVKPAEGAPTRKKSEEGPTATNVGGGSEVSNTPGSPTGTSKGSAPALKAGTIKKPAKTKVP